MTTDSPSLRVRVKAALHLLGPADRLDLAKHLNFPRDDINQISKALHALRSDGEIEREDAGGHGAHKWFVTRPDNKKSLGGFPPTKPLGPMPVFKVKDMDKVTPKLASPPAPPIRNMEASPLADVVTSMPTVESVPLAEAAAIQAAAFDPKTVQDAMAGLRSQLMPAGVRDRELKQDVLEGLAAILDLEIARVLMAISRDLDAPS